MRNNLHLNLLYNFVEAPNDFGQIQSYYKVLYLFSEVGPVATSTIEQIYKKTTAKPEVKEILFNTLDDLGQFAVDACIDLAAPEIFILSAQDYNIGLDSCNDVRNFREIFRRYGTAIANPNSGQRKKNVFSKLFES